MKKVFYLSISSALLIACDGDPELMTQDLDVDIASSSRAIVNGQPGGPGSVGLLRYINGGSNGYCSVTLIGPNTALTAKHCVSGSTNLSLCFDASGVNVAGPCFRPAVVTGVVQHPYEDVAVLHVSVTNSPTPSPISISAPVNNEAITMVGFGETTFGSPGAVANERRFANETIQYAYSTYFYSFFWLNGSSFSFGDSGGPALRNNAVIGVIRSFSSYAYGGSHYGYNYFERVDALAAWITDNAQGRVHYAENQNVNNPKDVDLSGTGGTTDFLLMLQFLAQNGTVSFPSPNTKGMLWDVNGDWGLSLEDVTPYGFRNIINSCDVNGDGVVTTSDALRVLNLLNAGHGGPLSGTNNLGSLPDVSGDNNLSSLDALRVINYLGGSTSSCIFFNGPIPPLP